MKALFPHLFLGYKIIVLRALKSLSIAGLDEAADIKQQVEDFILQRLVPTGLRLLATSRPEGVREKLYGADWVIADLKPLSKEQQMSVIEQQIPGMFTACRILSSTFPKSNDNHLG